MGTGLELDAVGKHNGYIRIHHSTGESAYGWIDVAVVSIRSGQEPVIPCVGGNHVDEFEGPISWTHLACRLGPADVPGQFIILPALNRPAAVAGRRVSPVDGLNLNCVCPGAPDGSPTQRIAHRLSEELPHPETTPILPRGGTCSDHFIYAPAAGLFKPFLEIGDEVSNGPTVGELTTPQRPWTEPSPIQAQLDGIVNCCRGPGRTQQRDDLIVIGVDI